MRIDNSTPFHFNIAVRPPYSRCDKCTLWIQHKTHPDMQITRKFGRTLQNATETASFLVELLFNAVGFACELFFMNMNILHFQKSILVAKKRRFTWFFSKIYKNKRANPISVSYSLVVKFLKSFCSIWQSESWLPKAQHHHLRLL